MKNRCMRCYEGLEKLCRNCRVFTVITRALSSNFQNQFSLLETAVLRAR